MDGYYFKNFTIENILKFIQDNSDETMVLKTGPDWPVQPGTGVQSGPVDWKNWKIRKMGQKPDTAGSTIKTANRSG